MSLADAFRQTAASIGANPHDLATVASYESGGKLNPAVMGGAGGRYAGIFQFGPWEQQHYGISNRSTAEDQVSAAGKFLVDRGFKPGMSLMDMYSAINAGHVGRNNASDAGNGGAPGSVADKVNTQMEGHKAKAAALLGALGGAPAGASPPQGQAPQAGSDLAAALPGATLPTLAPAMPVVIPAGPDPQVQAQQEQQAREQKVQAAQQQKQALLSVSAFYR